MKKDSGVPQKKKKMISKHFTGVQVSGSEQIQTTALEETQM